MIPEDFFLYEYAVIRYVPRVDREEFINIGLVMMCKRQKWLKGEIYINEQKIKAIDPFVNISKIEKQTVYFTRQDVPSSDIPVEEKYRWLTSIKSAVLQTSQSHPGCINVAGGPDKLPQKILEQEFSRLFHNLVF